MSTEDFLAELLSDDTPSPEELAAAPQLNSWQCKLDRAGPICMGIANSGLVVLRGIKAIDRRRQWVRTAAELWRLGKPFREPPIFEVVMAPDWYAALSNLLDLPEWPKSIRKLALDLDRDAKEPWPKRREMAREIRDAFGAAMMPDMADAFAVLGTDVGDKNDCYVITSVLKNTIGDRKVHSLDRILRGWYRLAEGCMNIDPDPVRAARAAGDVRTKIEDDIAKLKTPAVGDVVVREQDYVDECKDPGVVVVPKLGGVGGTTAKEVKEAFEAIEGRKVPLYPVVDVAKARAELVGEFPHAESLVNVLLSDLPGRAHLKLRNTLIVGPSGCGKSRFARRVGEALGVYVSGFDGAGAGDAAFGGTGRRWSSGEPCWPLNVIRACGHANPLICVDEIDKAGTGRQNGSLYSSILTLLEKETSSRFPDPYIQSPVDVSRVSYLMTCNDDKDLPATLKDRCRVLRMPAIKPEHVRAITRGIVADLAQERGLDPRWVVPLDGDEIEIASRMLGDGSIRRLRAVVERLLAQRETKAARN
jgi:hypothetical protein